MARRIKQPPSDLLAIGLDEKLLFACSRSGSCCQGRDPFSNVVSPTEFREMFYALRDAGCVTTIHDFVPGVIARVVSVAKSHPESARAPSHTFTSGAECDVRLGDEGVRFLGMYFRMIPDPEMTDGDRCVVLAGKKPGEFACIWHGSRAQPTQCALAPLALAAPLLELDEPKFLYPRSRLKWCEGMRRAHRGELPYTTPRAILERNHGEDRIREIIEIEKLRPAQAEWRPGDSEFSPLAQLYIDRTPELAEALEGY